jgi:hypothetical protein
MKALVEMTAMLTPGGRHAHWWATVAADAGQAG